MASFRVGLTVLFSFHALFLLPVPTLGDDEEDHLLQGLNSYRQSHNLPALQRNGKADCLADEVGGVIQRNACPATGYVASKPGPPPQVINYADMVKKCGIDPNTTQDAVVLPVCVPKRVETLILTNYTQSPNSIYLNSSKYAGAGIADDDDWTVVILTTSTVGGSLASAGCLSCAFEFSFHVLGLIVGWFVISSVAI